VPLGATYALQDPARLPEMVLQAVADDHDLVILGCGDGWVSSVVDLLVSRRWFWDFCRWAPQRTSPGHS
jgi:diacylglycerol kinase family enzyme